MDKHVRLVFVPGYPVTLESLCPKTQLLMLQGRLAAKGVSADVVDFASLTGLTAGEQADTGENRRVIAGWAGQITQGLGGFPLVMNLNSRMNSRKKADAVDQRTNVLLSGAPDILAFWVGNRDDFSEARHLCEHLLACGSKARRILIGPYALHYGAYAMGGCPGLDVAVMKNTTESLLAISACNAPKDLRHSVAGMLYRDADGVIERSEDMVVAKDVSSVHLAPFRRQDHDAPFPLFPLTFDCDPAVFCYQECRPATGGKKICTEVLDEIKYLKRICRARIFHVSSAGVPAEELDEFSNLLLTRNMTVIYSLGDVMESISASLAERLFASGCRSISFRIPAGSQQMIEDFYGCDMSISAMRRSVRNCREAGIFTVVRICYPCPLDDYHTRSEIELFVEKSNPDAVCIEPPVLMPESAWFKQAGEYGFFISHQDFHRYTVGEDCAYGALPYAMRGWTSRRIHQARRALASSLLKFGCMIDVTEQQGLLARLSRSAMEESVFVAELHEALEKNDCAHLRKLAECIHHSAQTLPFPAAASGESIGKAVSFS